MSESSSLARAEGLGYRIGSATLVSGVDLAVHPGELLGIIGPNGAGKSTLLRLLGGDLSPTDGRVFYAEAPTDHLAPNELALRRSVLMQQTNPDIPFTARAVVAMGRFPHRRDPENSDAEDARVVADALQRTDTAHLAERIFATLSGGERTRVSLARVLAQQAPLVLLDEPTTALDVAYQERIMAELRRLAGVGQGVVAVLHDLNTAAHYADRLLLLAQGQIRAEGTPRQVLSEALLSEVYRQSMAVVPHPFRECPLVLVTD